MRCSKKFLSILLSFLMIFSLINISSMKVKANSNSFDPKSLFKSKLVNYKDIDHRRALAQKYGTEIPDNIGKGIDEKIEPEDYVRVIVQVDKPSAIDMFKGKNKLVENISSLEAEVEEGQAAVRKVVERYGEIKHTYKCLVNGFSASVKYKNIESLRKSKGIKEVTIANKFYLDMNSAKEMSKVEQAWQASGLKGEGTVIAIVDTGVDYTHKDMKLTDPSKAKLDKSEVGALGGPGKYFSEKVPYGYNFADQNQQILDIYGNMHGMHVAGISAANGDEEEVKENNAIKGVAPEAQLLALKVFSNNNIDMPYAYTDDVVAAIEDAVKHEADVINMSLGSTAGFVRPEDPEQIAIKNATDAGVVVVVSGGNSGYSTIDVYRPYTMDADMGVAGTPGIAPDTVQVASIENTNIVCEALEYSGTSQGTIPYFTTDVKPVGILNSEYEIVDCNLGSVEDFDGKNLNNKIALIKRGINTFVDKQINAQNAGAAGVIIYNKDGDETYINMASDASIKIPAVFVKNSDGVLLKSDIPQGIKISFSGMRTTVDNALSYQMSDFSSWGSTPDLEFKPEVTAPGGNIYSTINDDKYEIMSGTSMASPYTAGAASIVVQYLKGFELEVSPREFAELAKKILISTAEPVIDPNTNLPYLTRKQGAGLVNLENAVNTKAYVEGSNGNATIALKEIGNTKQFKFTINNFGNDELVFDVCDEYGVLTNYTRSGFIYIESKAIKEASLTFDNTTVTVPAKGTKEITATLNIPQGTAKNIFAEGFITLKSKTEGQSSLGIPYMGFYGKWSGEAGPRVFDAPMWDYENTYFGMTTLITKDGNYLGLEGVDERDNPIVNKDIISFSPNKDGEFDDVMPLVSFMRNAKEFTVQILDKDNNVVREIAYNNNIRKNYTDGKTFFAAYDDSWAWDGTIYNPQTGRMCVAPEGDYTVRLIGVPDYANAEQYILNMPIKLDITEPKLDASLEKLEGNDYKIKISNSEDNVAISSYMAAIFTNDSDKPQSIVEIPGDEKEKIIQLPNNVLAVAVAAMDYAGNIGVKVLETQNNTVNIEPLNLVDDLYTSNKDMTIKYTVNDMLVSLFDFIGVTVDNKAEVNNEKNLSYELRDLEEGAHKVTVKLYSKDGKNIGESSISFIVDTTAPVITIIDPAESPVTLSNGEDAYVMKIKVAENLSGYKLYINDEEFSEKPDMPGTRIEKEHEYNVILAEGETKVKVQAIDAAGNKAESKEIVFNSGFAKPVIKITSPDENMLIISGKDVTVRGNVAYNQGKNVVVTINGEEVTVGDNGEFAKTITYDSYGQKTIKIEAVAEDEKNNSKEINITLSPLTIIDLDSESRLFTTTSAATIVYDLDTTDENVDKVKVTVDDREPIIKGKHQNSVEITGLAEGEHDVVFDVMDKGNESIAQIIASLIYDTDPAITFDVKDEDGNIISQQDIYNRKEIVAHGNVSKKVREIKFIVNYTEDGVAKTKEPIYADINGLDFDVTLELEEGMNRVTIGITDLAGNYNEYQMKVFVDTLEPDVIFVNPETGNEIRTSEPAYTFKFKVSDNTWGYDVYVNKEKIDSVDGELGTGTEEKLISYEYKVPAGDSKVIIKVIDRAGNWISKTFIVVSDDEFIDAEVGAPSVEYDKKSPKDIEVPVKFNSDELFKLSLISEPGTSIKTDLIKGEDFIINENSITIKSQFVDSLPVGEYYLRFTFKSGNNADVELYIVDTRESDSLLKNIKIDGKAITGFNGNKFNYVIEMSPFDTIIPEVSCEANDVSAKVEITQAEKMGDTAVVKVTANSGTQKVYRIKFIVPLTIENVSGITEFEKGKPATVTMRASNISDRTKVAILLIGIYDKDGRFIDYIEGQYTIKPEESVEMSATLNTLNSSAYKIKCFIWDNMNPLSEVFEFLIK